MLKINQANYDLIREHGERGYPQECCGILLGSLANNYRTVRSIYPCNNAHPEPSRHYSLDSLEVIRAQRLARDQGLDIVGFYHSHPDHPAQYSETDLAWAHWPNCSYVITSVQEGRAFETKSFLLQGPEESKMFSDEEIEII